MRLGWQIGSAGLIIGVGCGLLTPYPGGGNAAQLLADQAGGTNGSPFSTGTPQEALLDPAIDNTVSVLSNERVIVAIPGSAFTVDLEFSAANANVVGGGIKLQGSDEIQWTLVEGLEGKERGRIQFGYVVDANVCDDVAPLCHRIETDQFAVARNSAANGDIDGDGEADGDFVVSPPVPVTVVLRCASCESPSCLEIEELAGECQVCAQPQMCTQVQELCFDEGRPKHGTDEADDFSQFFGPDGLAWKNATTCAPGPDGNSAADQLCQSALDDALLECMDDLSDPEPVDPSTPSDSTPTPDEAMEPAP